MTTTETIDHLEAQLALLEPDERLEVFSRFCKYCGAYDPDCQCWDEIPVTKPIAIIRIFNWPATVSADETVIMADFYPCGGASGLGIHNHTICISGFRGTHCRNLSMNRRD